MAEFSCDNLAYQVIATDDSTGGINNSQLRSINPVTGQIITVNSDMGAIVNAIGYNPLDNFIYGIYDTNDPNQGQLARIEDDGTITNLGPIPNMTETNIAMGTFDDAGYFYIKHQNRIEYYVVDLIPGSPTYGQLVDPTNNYVLATAPYYQELTGIGQTSGDWVFIDGELYTNDKTLGQPVAIDPTTNTLTYLNTVPATLPMDGGGWFATNDNFIYTISNSTGNIVRWKRNGTDMGGTLFSVSQLATRQDATICPNARLLIDFGDAPDTDAATQGQGNYRTLLESDGPRHGTPNNLFIGAAVTIEDDALQNATATGDSDDGSIVPIEVIAGTGEVTIPITVTNESGQDANLYAWIDTNADGIFQTQEGIELIVPSQIGLQNIDLVFDNIPGIRAETFMRVRLTTDTLVNTGTAGTEDTRSYGPASDGEVEDYQIVFAEQEPIPCEASAIQFGTSGANTPLRWIDINIVTGEAVIRGEFTGIQGGNAIAYNPTDNYIYSFSNNVVPNELLKVGNDLSVLPLGVTLNDSDQTVTGAIDQNGYMYILTNIGAKFYVLDVNVNSPNYLSFVDPTNNFVPTTSSFNFNTNIFVPDWTFNVNDGLLYGVRTDGTVVRYNPITLEASLLTTTPLIDGPYGAMFSDSEGKVYAINNTTGAIYRININGNNAEVEFFTDSFAAPGNDATMCINATVEIDFGDAPDTANGTSSGNYRSLLSNNGPRHQILNSLFIGSAVTAELDALQNPTATGDSDDGLVAPVEIPIGVTTTTIPITVTNEIGEDANLYAWIDFNNDGIFQTNEGISTVVSSQAGAQTINLNFSNIPAGLVDPTFMRVRLTTNNLTNSGGATEEDTRSFGPAGDGEVEDYLVEFRGQAELEVVKSQSVDFLDIGDTLTYTINVTNIGNISADNAVLTDIIPNDTTYVAGTLMVDGVSSSDNLATGVTLPSPILENQTVVVTFDILVNQIPSPNPILNKASVVYESNGNSLTSESNEVSAQVNTADLIGDNNENFIKSVDKEFAKIGDEITYTISVTNTGNVPANNVVITDPIPNGTSYVAGSLTVNGVANPSNPETGINLANPIQPNETVVIVFKVLVTEIPVPNPIPNKASVDYTYTVDPQNPNSESESGETNEVLTQVNVADLIGDNNENFIKSVDKEFAKIGDEITYTISVTNTGNVSANNVVITDPIPNGTSYVIGSLTVNGVANPSNPETGVSLGNPIQPNETVVIVFKVLVTEIPNPNPIPNKASVDYTYTADPQNPNGESESGETNEVLTQISKADLIGENGENFVKTTDKQYADIGDEITYTISVTNTGNVSANNVVITDPIPNGTSYVIGSLTVNGALNPSNPETGINLASPIQPNATVILIFRVLVNEIPVPNPIPNKASVDYTYTVDPQNPNSESESGETNEVTTQINNADLIGDNNENFVKSVDKDFAKVGDEITYTISVTNTGNVAANNVVITDPIPNGTSYVAGSLTVNGALNPSNPETGISLINPIQPNATVIIVFRVLVTEIPVPNPIPNKASVDYTYTVDPQNPNSESESGETNEVLTQINKADLIGENGENFVKITDKQYADIGDEITYTISVTNTGNVPANNVVITDPIPNGTSYVAGSLTVNGVTNPSNPETGISLANPIQPNATVIIVFKVLVNEIPVPNPIPNKASVDYTYTADPQNPNGVKESGETNEVTTQINNADLIGENGENFVKTTDKQYADVGDEITYTISVTNTGNVAANNVVITDPIPNGTSYVAGSLTVNGVTNPSNPETGISLANPIQPNATVIIVFKVLVTEIPNPNPIPNKASVDYTYTVDPQNPNGETDSGETNEVTTQINNADLSGENGENFVKATDKEYADIGDEITYTITVKNTGNVPANNVVITDPIPNGTSYVIGSLVVDGVFNPSNPETGISLANPIQPNQTIVIVFKVLVEEIPVPNPIPNKASATYTYTVNPQNPNGENASAQTNQVLTQVNNADLVGDNGENFVKLVDKAYVDVGDEITYTINATNTGNVPANNVVITDPIPNGTIFIQNSLKINGVSNFSNPQTGIIIPNPVKAGETVVVEFKVLVTEIPVPNPIPNKANITYTYTVNPQNPNGETDSGETNEVTTQVNNADLIGDNNENYRKYADKQYADVGDEITYTITVANTGNVPANNVVIKDQIPIGTSYVQGSLIVNGAFNPSNPSIGINLANPILPNQTVIIVFRVLVEEIPVQNPIVNKGEIEYTYTVDPQNPNGETDSGETNEVITQINNADLIGDNGENFIKTADKQYADVGDEINYSISVSNTGNVPANNVVITDPIPNGTSFIQGSLTINGVANSGNPQNGIALVNPIPAGGSILLEFKVLVIEIPVPNPIVNKAQIEYTYTVDPNRPNGEKENGETNEAITQINNADLIGENGENFVKKVDKQYADVGDEITYTITVTNTGNVSANNVVITDPIPGGTKFVQGSLKINGVVNIGNPQNGIALLNPILPNQTVIITFKVLVAQIPEINPVLNKAEVEYTYTTNPQNPNGEEDRGETNQVETEIKNGVILPEDAVKDANRVSTVVGDIFEYSISLKNSGNIKVTNVNVEDALPVGVEFIDGTTKIDNIATSQSPVSGINISQIDVNQTVVITFNVEVVSNSFDGKLRNKAEISYNHEVDPNEPPVVDKVETNEVVVDILNPELLVEKESNRDGAILLDKINYKIKVTNTGQIKLTDVIVSDDLDNALQYDNNLRVDGVSVNGSILDGINIGDLDINEFKIVSFNVIVISDNKEMVSNNAEASFEYTIEDNIFNSSQISNEVNVNIYNPEIDIRKYSNIDTLKVGDIFEYTIELKNVGNIMLSNINVSDMIPSQLEILEVRINDIPINSGLDGNININSLAVDEMVVIILSVKAIDSIREFKNIVIVEADVITDPNIPPSTIDAEAESEDELNIYKPELTIEKSANKSSVIVGEVIEYTITVQNTGDIVLGNVELENVIIYDNLDKNIAFVAGTLSVNGIPDPDSGVVEGVNIGILNPGAKSVIKFKVEVIASEPNTAENIAVGTFGFILPGTDLAQIAEDVSNKVVVEIFEASLRMEKDADVEFVMLGDIITYTITITNDGNIKARNIIFKDTISKGTVFIEESFKLNGVQVNSVNLYKGLNVGDLEVDESLEIEYQVKLISTTCNHQIENVANAKFSYVLPDNRSGFKGFDATEARSSVEARIATFKQMSVEEELEIPVAKPDVESINEVTGTVDIMKCHLIQTANLISQENQRITGYKLVVTGMLNIVIKYTALDTEQSVHSAHYKIPFSTFIVLPETYHVGSKLDVNGMVEDIYLKTHDERSFFTNTTLMIAIKILDC